MKTKRFRKTIKINPKNIEKYLLEKSLLHFLEKEFNKVPELFNRYRFRPNHKIRQIDYNQFLLVNLEIKKIDKQFVDRLLSSLFPSNSIPMTTSGRGKTFYVIDDLPFYPESFHPLYQQSSENIENGYTSLEKTLIHRITLRIQYKDNKLLIYLYSREHHYISKIEMVDKKFVSFENNKNHTMEHFKENMLFFLLTEYYQADLQEIIEQDITFQEKLELADMINI